MRRKAEEQEKGEGEMSEVNTQTSAQAPSLLGSVTEAIGRLKSEQAQAEFEAQPFRGAAPTINGQERAQQLVALGETITRLEQIEVWLQSDPHLLAIVDEHVGKHVRTQTRTLQRQNLVLSIAMTLVGALLGWLLSLLLPASFVLGRLPLFSRIIAVMLASRLNA
jgi:hypothetical protein